MFKRLFRTMYLMNRVSCRTCEWFNKESDTKPHSTCDHPKNFKYRWYWDGPNRDRLWKFYNKNRRGTCPLWQQTK